MADLGTFEDDLVEAAREDLREQPGAYSNKTITVTGADGSREILEEFVRQFEDDSREALAKRVNAACAEIGRELGYRRSVYPRLIAAKKLSPDKAAAQELALEDAAKLIRELSGVGR